MRAGPLKGTIATELSEVHSPMPWSDWLRKRCRVRLRAVVLCVGMLTQGPLALAQDSSHGQDTIPAKREAQTSFATVKGLAGTWVGSVTTDPHNPDIEGPIE